MNIIGLEGNGFCVFKPIPVLVQKTHASNELEIKLFIDNEEVLFNAPKFKSFGGDIFRIDLAPWILIALSRREFADVIYKEQVQDINPSHSGEVEVRCINGDDKLDIKKKYFGCANNKVLLTDNKPVRAWSGYPFSFQCNDKIRLGIPFSAPDLDRCVEFTEECCGTYVRWLNEKGFYNYWMFRNRTIERKGKEIYSVNRSIFDIDKSARKDTVGFEGEDVLSVQDVVPRMYFPLFGSLPTSPEVHILRTDWKVGENLIATENDWVKVIQDFEFSYSDNKHATEVEIAFELPEPYTQKYI